MKKKIISTMEKTTTKKTLVPLTRAHPVRERRQTEQAAPDSIKGFGTLLKGSSVPKPSSFGLYPALEAATSVWRTGACREVQLFR